MKTSTLRITMIIVCFLIASGLHNTIQHNACNLDFAVNVERNHTVIYENCEISGYVFDSSYPRFTDDNNRTLVNYKGEMIEIVETLLASENGHIYSSVDFGGIHDAYLPISSYVLHYTGNNDNE